MAVGFVSRQCSVTCGEGIQQRQVVCKASDNTAAECEGEKPETVVICELIPCPGEGEKKQRPRRGGVGWGRRHLRRSELAADSAHSSL